MSLLIGSELATGVTKHPHELRELPVLVLMVHSRCNCRCVMCDIWKVAETRQLQLSDLQPHLESLRKLHVQWIVFSGGEPLMNPGLFPLIEAVREMGIRTTLLTTGLLLSRYAADAATMLDEIIVSLDGPPSIHDAIRNVPGAFASMAAGVRRIKHLNQRLPIRARTTVQKSNFRHLRSTVATAREMELDSISFLAADVTSAAFNRELLWPVERQSQVALSAEEIEILDSEISALIRLNGDDIASGFIAESEGKLRRIVRHFRAQLGEVESFAPRCNAPWVSAVVESDGSVRPCFFHPSIGSLHDSDLRDVLNSPAALAFRKNLDIESDPVCRRCVCSLNFPARTQFKGEDTDAS